MNEFTNTNNGEENNYLTPTFTTEATGEQFYYPTKDTRIEKLSNGYIPAYQYYSRIYHANKWVSAHSQEWQESPVYRVYKNLNEAIAISRAASELHKLTHIRLQLERSLYLK